MKKSGMFIVLACLVVLSGFALAEVLVVYSAGGNFTGIDEDVNVVFNISINNTDQGSPTNITQVNITLPAQMTFDPNSQGSDAPQHNFSVDSQVLSWSNLTYFLVNNVTLNYFYFNATGNSPGTYIIQVFTTNGTRTLNENLTIEINDTSKPDSIEFQDPTPANFANLSQQNIEFNVTASDNWNISAILLEVFNATGDLLNNTVSGANASTLYLNFSFLTVEGTYTINATVNDTAGNVNSTSSRTVTLDRTNPTVALDVVTTGSDSLTINVANGDTNSLGVQGSVVAGTCGTSLGTITGTGAKQVITASSLTCLTSYTITATCTDAAGNSGTGSGTFTTGPCGGETGSGGSGSSSTTTDDTSDDSGSDGTADGSSGSESDVSGSDSSGLGGTTSSGMSAKNRNILVGVIGLLLVGIVWWMTQKKR